MYLLDTHALVFFLDDNPDLPAKTRDVIESEETLYISIASFWELAIKESIGKIKLPAAIHELMDYCIDNGISIIPIEADHLSRIKDLPKYHGDPFDRMIICQAMVHDLTIVTRDGFIPRYNVKTIWK